MDLNGKVLLITGASSGIGAATAKMLEQDGVRFILTGRNEQKLAELAGQLQHAVIVVGDITDPSLPERLLQAALTSFNRLDYVFNNAGVMHIGNVDEADVDALCHMVRVNFEALVRVSYTMLRHMKSQGSGFLINTSSLAGLKTFPGIGAYNGTKFAVEAFTDALRMELAGSGVRVAAIEPGRTDTGLFDHWPDDKKFNPAEGMLQPEDIARCVRFMLIQPEEVLVPRLLVVPSKQPR